MINYLNAAERIGEVSARVPRRTSERSHARGSDSTYMNAKQPPTSKPEQKYAGIKRCRFRFHLVFTYVTFLTCPDAAANPQRPQGLGVRAGLRPGAAHAAERLPRRHAQGVERGQLHPHRRGQRSRQPHQRHLHQLQADLHCVQVKQEAAGDEARFVASRQAAACVWMQRTCSSLYFI